MKTSTKIFAILLFASLFVSCSVEDVNEDNTQNIELATGGEDSSEVDDDRDPDGE